jgi:hypothetical protein
MTLDRIERIAAKKEKILELARKMGTEEDGHDYIDDVAIAGAELVDLEKEETKNG